MGRLRSRQAGAVSKAKRKQSVRLMMQNYRSGLDKKAKTHYLWPRTVEAANNAFEDSSGKNKMFYMIACELYPFKQIIVPSDSESDGEDEECEVDYDDPANQDLFGSSCSLDIRKPRRRYYTSQQTGKRIGIGRSSDVDLSWRSQYNRRRVQKRSSLRPKRSGIVDQRLILDVINTVVQRFSNSITEEKIEVEPHFVPPPRVEVEVISYPAPTSSAGDEIDEDEEDDGLDAVEDSEETISNEGESVQGETPSHDEDDSEKEEHESYTDNVELVFMRQQMIQPNLVGSATCL